MIKIRKSRDRGQSKSAWLQSAHTFSFGDYYASEFTEFGALRVINEDIIQPGQGFGMHAHQHMEIMTYVVDGVLEHNDSMGNGSQIVPGEIQCMSAGQGIRHSEFNPSSTQALHLLQIWIRPATTDLKPSYQQKGISKADNEFVLIAAEQANNQVVTINQDANVFVAFLTQDNELNFPIDLNRRVWIQLIKGQIQLNNIIMQAGDGAAIVDEQLLHIVCDEKAELLLFDLAIEV